MLWSHLELINFSFIYSNLILDCIWTLIILGLILCKDSSPCDAWPCFHHRLQQHCSCPSMLLHKLLWLIPSLCGFNSILFCTGFTATIKRSLCHLCLHQECFPCAREKGDKGEEGNKGRGVLTDRWTPSWLQLGSSSHMLWFCQCSSSRNMMLFGTWFACIEQNRPPTGWL